MKVKLINRESIAPDTEGFELIISDPPEVSSTSEVLPYYEVDGGCVYQRWEATTLSAISIRAKIKILKTKLEDSDYKVVKNYELQMVGEELEYDPAELRAVRQPIRDEINRLEALLLE